MIHHERNPLFVVAIGLLCAIMLAPIVFMFASVPISDVSRLAGDPAIHDAFRVSLVASLLAVLAATTLGVPAGYGLANISERWRAILLFLLALPLAFPPVASGIILLNALSAHFALGAFLLLHG
nr:hypothetical protein [Candidatus Eremiobacteraeota bacterium]